MSVPEITQRPSARRPWLAAITEPASVMEALKWGALIGAAYFLVSLLINVLFNLVVNTGNLTIIAIPACIDIFALVFALYGAGFRAGAERNHIAPGVVSAAIMLIVFQALNSIYGAIVRIQPTTQKTSASNIVYLFVVIMVCLVIGYMGAFYGVKNNAKRLAASK